MAASIATALRALERGRLVVVPTDTLVALAANARAPAAVARLMRAKGRPSDRRVSIAVSSTEEVGIWVDLTDAGRRFVRRQLPGPWTILARPSRRARRELAPEIAGGPRLGVRVPDHPLLRELARRAGPVTATSANRSGAPASPTVALARRALGDEVAVYLDGPPRPSGVPSVLVDLSGPAPAVVARR